MINGLVLTAVGMLTVFGFLIVLVVSMSLLRSFAARWPATPPGADTAVVAAAVAAIQHREASRSQSNSSRGGGRA